jgi:class 3 adenylate cyclase
VLDAGGEIFGDVPNIAWRAQALAEPGTVVVTGRVQRQVVDLAVGRSVQIEGTKAAAEAPRTSAAPLLYGADHLSQLRDASA